MRRLLVSLLGALCLVDIALGQVRPVVSSLESMVASNDNVYVGYVTKVDNEKWVAGRSYSEFEATVTVTETLNGTPVKIFTCTRYTSETYADFQDREKEHTAHLWFNRTTPYENYSNWTPGWGTNNGWDWPTMDYKIVSGQAATTKRIKEFVKANPGLYGTTSIMSCAPSPIVRPSRGIVDYILPVCPATEGLARRLLDKPEQFLPQDDRIENAKKSDESYRGLLRREAMYLLSNYKSDKNIQIVKKYLDDPSVVLYNPSKDFRVTDMHYDLWYWVRSTAYELLEKWGVKVDRPVEEAPASTLKSTDGLFVWDRRPRFR